MTASARFYLPIIACLLLAACASASATIPPWDTSPAAMRQVFPDSDFSLEAGF